MSIPSDDYFVALLENTWGAPEDDASKNFDYKVRHIVSMLRQRLMVLSNNSDEEFQLRKIFNSFDTDRSGSISADDFAAMLAKLGISVERKYIEATLKKIDHKGQGVIEFDEFTNFILYNQFKH